MEAIYERPRDYDLEHEGDEEDVAFYLQLLGRWRPGRVMELAAGNGRVTIPIACAAAASGIQIVGLEREGPMLKEAMRKRAGLDEDVRGCLAFMTGDMRAWRAEQQFDLVIAPCSFHVRWSCSFGTLGFPWRRGSATTRCGGYGSQVAN